MTTQLRPYSVLQFMDDVEEAFKFLEEDYGFVEASSKWTSHRADLSMREHVTSALPHVKYSASMREVSIRHDPRGAVEVIVRIEFPDSRRATVEELAREQGDVEPQRFAEIYDMTTATAGDRIRTLADGLRKFGVAWLREPEAP